MSCTHAPNAGACYSCHPEMFRFSPEQVEAMNKLLIARQRCSPDMNANGVQSLQRKQTSRHKPLWKHGNWQEIA